MFEKQVFSSLADSFASVLAVKGALRRARKRRALDRCGPLQEAPLGRKSKTKRPQRVFFVNTVFFLVLRPGFVFHQKMLRQNRLGTTIANSLDP